ncbi:MAG TPA: putative N-acetylmannosamine-6-phosphate 2-epimerase [Candidatus Baltobacteraceae bacterium]|nr:putative N-acetylmannosamine-6-phosphate 2-epimerase [Candidatus Baltobacteraceae bacterium]
MNAILDRLRGGLIVSVQAAEGSALDDPATIAAMADAAVEGGAAGVRIQGVANLRAVRARVGVPIVGLIKRQHEGYEPYITASLEDVRAVLDAGAEIVAFDATDRAHPGDATVPRLIAAIHGSGALAMADCAVSSDGIAAAAAGADIVGTTLAGYTPHTRGRDLPALDVLQSWHSLDAFKICEGGVHSPGDAAEALAAYADAVVVGTAITNIGWVTARYVQAMGELPRRKSWPA